MKNMVSFSALMLAMSFAPIAYASSGNVGEAFARGMVLGLAMMLFAGMIKLLAFVIQFIYNKLFK